MTTTSSSIRPDVQTLRDRGDVDVLIIGGGINGIATFRDLALQGVDVALVERGDFVSGASAASSHMIHGGIRYLENGEFRLVQRVRDRSATALLQIAPHYVKPLQTTIPIFSTFSGILSAPAALPHAQAAASPGARRAADQDRPDDLRLLLARRRHASPATASTDARSRSRTCPRSTRTSSTPRRTTTPRCTTPSASRSTCCTTASPPAGPAAHAPSTTSRPSARERRRASCCATASTGDEFPVRADVVVNASGPWTDLTNDALGVQTPLHGRHQGLAHRARQPRAARRPRRAARSSSRTTTAASCSSTRSRDASSSAPPTSTPTRASPRSAPRRRSTTSSTSSSTSSRHRGRPRRRSSTRSPASARCPATTTPPPASSRATTASRSTTHGPARPCSASSAASGRRSARSPSTSARRTLATARRARTASHRRSRRSAAARTSRDTGRAARTWVRAHSAGTRRRARRASCSTRYGTRAAEVLEAIAAGRGEPLPARRRLLPRGAARTSSARAGRAPHGRAAAPHRASRSPAA